MLNTGRQPNVTVSFNTEPYDPQRPDVVAEVLIPPGAQKP
jgi:hypothetical protein